MAESEIETRIEQVKNYIHDCERRVAQGEAVDLTGLDKNMEEVCQDVMALPAEEGKKLQGKLSGLVSALDKLVTIIHEFHQTHQSDEDEDATVDAEDESK